MNTFIHPALVAAGAALILSTLGANQPAHAAGSTNPRLLPPATIVATGITPRAALQARGAPSSGMRALGFVPNPGAQSVPVVSSAVRLALPASVDLSQYNPPVGDQGGVLSCVSWAIGYYMRGWFASHDGYYPSAGAGGFAPMYLYSQVPKYDSNGNQIARNQNGGTRFADNLNVLAQQGIDTRADYTQGDYDYADLPSAVETSNAAHVRIASYSDVTGSNLQQWIESTMAGGKPVVLGIPVYPEFDNARASSPLVGLPTSGETSRGNHAVFASAYDANGVWVENQWGTGWGLNGWAELSWSFVNRYAFEALTETPLGPGGFVPRVIGQRVSTAAAAVRAAGFAVAVASAPDRSCNYLGLVFRETPAFGSWAVYGSTITLTVGSRPPTPCP